MRAAAVMNEEGNMWVIGGTSDDSGLNGTEVYHDGSNGTGKWTQGPMLPVGLRGGIESHCTVR